jgi:MYXO-CTERM domain-containing protein
MVALAAFVCASSAAAPAFATDYYTAPSGDDSSSGTEAQPFKTIKHGASVLTPGDTLWVRAGTYAEELNNDIPAGTSWASPVTVAAYPGDKPVIQPASGASRVLTFASQSSSYVIVDGFVLDAKNASVDAVKVTLGSSGGASHHVRIVRSEVMNSPGQGILVTGEVGKNGLDVTGNEFIDLDVHDNGTTDFDHGFYISTAGNLVERCRVHANAGWGIHVYNGSADDADDNVIRGNRSYDNARVGNRGVGIGIYSGSGTLAYNNLIWGNKIGIALNYGATDAGVYNNVVYGNLEAGISVGPETTGASVVNDVVWQNPIGLDDSGSGTSTDANLVDVDPGLTDPANQDFRPTPASPVIDQGTTLPEVAVDIDGVLRPQGAAYDIGAYEYCATGCGGAAGAAGSAGSSSGGASTGGSSTGGSSTGGSSTGGGGSGGSPSSGGGSAASSDDGGCGCRTSQKPIDSPLGLLALAVAAGLCARRRPTLLLSSSWASSTSPR